MLEEEYSSDWDSDLDDEGVDDCYADGSDIDEFDAEPSVPCPYCHHEIHEESPRCPNCGQYISAEDSPPASKPWWIVIGAVAALYAALRWIF